MALDDTILLNVRRPAQYTGGEWNVSRADFTQAEVKFCLCFPDLYEIGMSNLGLRIIYGILNNTPGVVCERMFAPELDMEIKLRESKEGMPSLESGKRLSEFDIAGFSLGSELGYANVLNILDLGGVPLESSCRSHEHPLIIAGGPCAINPEPMHAFFDLFVIGEAEDAIAELVEVYRKHKQAYKAGSLPKQELLLEFSKIEGVYVPAFYEAVSAGAGVIKEFNPKIKGAPGRVRKRIVRDLDSSFFPLQWLVPYVKIVHDRITLEIMRGCPNRCRFCQARSGYYPLRHRNIDKVLELAARIYKATGYEEVSLAGLSISEYPQIDELVASLINMFQEKKVSVSLPSIKAKSKTAGLTKIIANIKKTGLTYAPEAGSSRLREALAKDFNEEDFFNSLAESYAAGYQHVKLYFMIGLPHETEADLDAIADFSKRVSNLRAKVGKSPAQVNVSINALVPKPHTPLQWLKMVDCEEIKYKQEYLKARIKNRRIKVNFHDRYMSFLEGVFSRGDRSLSRVISAAFKKGARLDAWGNNFQYSRWEEAFKECGIEPVDFLREKDTADILPWDFIDMGISKESLISEFDKCNNASSSLPPPQN